MPVLSPRPILRFLTQMLPLLVLVSGCATQHPSKKSDVWASRGQFVTALDREEGATANQHPVTLSVSKLRAELAALRVQLPDSAKPTPLFDEGELDNLSKQIPAGLQQAGSDQDLVFAVTGEIPYLKGFGHQDVVTTGRVFYRGNRLNLILGLLREIIKESDRRLQPFAPGSRLKAASLPGPVTTTSATTSFEPNRPDWITMAIPEAGAEPSLPQAENQPEKKSAAPAPAPANSDTTKPAKSIEERLRILKDLKAKGLITDEDYRAKKESILKEL